MGGIKMVNGIAESKAALTEEFRRLLEEDDNFAYYGLKIVYNNQTVDEKQSESVNHNNGVGFRAQDAKFLSSLAAQYFNRRILSEKQLKWLHKMMPVYAGQIVETIAQYDEKLKVYWW